MEIKKKFLLIRAVNDPDQNGHVHEKFLNKFRTQNEIHAFVMRFIQEWIKEGPFYDASLNDELCAISFENNMVDKTYTFMKDDLWRLLYDWLMSVIQMAIEMMDKPKIGTYTSERIHVRVVHDDETGNIRIEVLYNPNAHANSVLEICVNHQPVNEMIDKDPAKTVKDFEREYSGLKFYPGLYLNLETHLSDVMIDDPEIEQRLRLHDVMTIGDLLEADPENLKVVSPVAVTMRESILQFLKDYSINPHQFSWRCS